MCDARVAMPSDDEPLRATPPMSHRTGTRAWRAWGAPLAVSGLSLATVRLLGAGVHARAAAGLDLTVQRQVLAHQAPLVQRLAFLVTVAGGITAMRVLAALAAALLWRRAGWRSGACLVAAPFLAELLCDATKRGYARARPLGLGQGVDPTWAYPSAHAAVSAATCAMIAYACRREGLLTPTRALALALGVPALVGASRILLNVHWTTDVVGGWFTGLAVSALLIAGLRYDADRPMTGLRHGRS
ncbi:MAG: superfamily [Gemmatimonadetes bacterium]|jgi:membrane-associated phospholipid phosphatase|nr:superfamily [Gemmatimonadota bacterium]